MAILTERTNFKDYEDTIQARIINDVVDTSISAYDDSKKAVTLATEAGNSAKLSEQAVIQASKRIEEATNDLVDLRTELIEDVEIAVKSSDEAKHDASGALKSANDAMAISSDTKEIIDKLVSYVDDSQANEIGVASVFIRDGILHFQSLKGESTSIFRYFGESVENEVEISKIYNPKNHKLNKGDVVLDSNGGVAQLNQLTDRNWTTNNYYKIGNSLTNLVFSANAEGKRILVANTDKGYIDNVDLLGLTIDGISVSSVVNINSSTRNILNFSASPIKIVNDNNTSQNRYEVIDKDTLRVGGNYALYATTSGWEMAVQEGTHYWLSGRLKFYFNVTPNSSATFQGMVYDLTSGLPSLNNPIATIAATVNAVSGEIDYGYFANKFTVPIGCERIGIVFTCNWGSAASNNNYYILSQPQVEMGQEATNYIRYLGNINTVTIKGINGALYELASVGDIRDKVYYKRDINRFYLERNTLASPNTVELDFESMKGLLSIPTYQAGTYLSSNAVLGVRELQLNGRHRAVVLKDNIGNPLDPHTSSQMVIRPNGESVEQALSKKASQSEIEQIVKKEDYLYSSNSFGNNKVLIDRISDTFWAANWRTPVAATLHMKEVGGITYPRSAAGDYPFEDSPIVKTLTITEMNTMFDRYEGTRFTVPAGQYLKLSIGALQTLTGGFPYGQFSVQYYNNAHSESSTFRYRFVQSGTWSNVNGSPYENNGVVSYDYYTNWNYVNAMDIIVIAPDNRTCEIQEMEMLGLRTDLPNLPYVSKNANNDIYASFTFKNASGQIKASIKNGDGSADFYRLTENGMRVYSPANPQKVYDVGDLYITASSISPASKFGGTWERIEGKFLMGNSAAFPAGTSGGNSVHTLTASELPAHSHTYEKFNVTNPSHYTHAPANFAETWWGTETSSTSSMGNNKEFSILPPYLSVYIWKRIN